jgi:hypothetical protein
VNQGGTQPRSRRRSVEQCPVTSADEIVIDVAFEPASDGERSASSRADLEWLQSLPVRSRLADPTIFDVEALLCAPHKLSLTCSARYTNTRPRRSGRALIIRNIAIGSRRFSPSSLESSHPPSGGSVTSVTAEGRHRAWRRERHALRATAPVSSLRMWERSAPIQPDVELRAGGDRA